MKSRFLKRFGCVLLLLLASCTVPIAAPLDESEKKMIVDYLGEQIEIGAMEMLPDALAATNAQDSLMGCSGPTSLELKDLNYSFAREKIYTESETFDTIKVTLRFNTKLIFPGQSDDSCLERYRNLDENIAKYFEDRCRNEAVFQFLDQPLVLYPNPLDGCALALML